MQPKKGSDPGKLALQNIPSLKGWVSVLRSCHVNMAFISTFQSGLFPVISHLMVFVFVSGQLYKMPIGTNGYRSVLLSLSLLV